MKNRLVSARTAIVVSVVLGATASIVACVGDAFSVGGDGVDAGTEGDFEGGDQPVAPTGPSDAGLDGAYEEITEGGGGGELEEEDGGLDDDGGVDAGPACGAVTVGEYAKSGCSTIIVRPAGGALTTAEYELTKVTVVGTLEVCGKGGTYVAYDHRGGLKVTATSATTATFEFMDQYRKSGGGLIVRSTTVRWDADVTTSGGNIAFAQRDCALKPAPEKGTYTASVDKVGKKVLSLRIPYGNGTAIYSFVEKK